MSVAVVDAGVAIGWVLRRPRALRRIDRLFAAGRAGTIDLCLSLVNLAEVLMHTAEAARATGVDPVALLRATGVRLHAPTESVARRVARLQTSLADGFAAATALELRARLHTTDTELAGQLRDARISVTLY